MDHHTKKFKNLEVSRHTENTRSHIYLSNKKSDTSNDLAIEARILALKSIPTKQAMPATKAANTAAYLQKQQSISFAVVNYIKF